MAEGAGQPPISAPVSRMLEPALRAFEPLRRAEQILLKACRAGDIARIGMRRPLAPSPEITLRGEFVRTLVRGEGLRLRGRRIQMLGGWVEGRLDLRDASVPVSLWFYRCVFDATPLFDGALVSGSVGFPDCHLPGFRAETSTIVGELALNSGCTVRGEVRLARATIGRNLNCERLGLRSENEAAAVARRPLIVDGAHIAGDVILADGFESDGEVRLVGVRIDGDLRMANARLHGDVDKEGVRGDALNLDRASIAGSVILRDGFSAAGRVRLARAHIEGDLDCNGAVFDVFGDAAWGGRVALVMDRAEIGGSLVLTKLKSPLLGASFAGVRAGTLIDDATTWGERLVLDEFTYGRLADGAPTTARFRLAWIGLQEGAHLGSDFRPAPWHQLISVLRSMSQDASARDVAVAREAHLRRIGRVGAGAPRGWRWLPRSLHAVFGALAGYGYRPGRLVAAMLVLWLACGAAYWAASEQGLMAPTNPHVFDDPRYAPCRLGSSAPGVVRNGESGHASWTRCPALATEYPEFNPLVYSLDLLLPLVDLQQEREWAPLTAAGERGQGAAWRRAEPWGIATRVLAWFEILFGWAASLTLLAALTRLTDRDRSR
jgi:hypothetical protein